LTTYFVTFIKTKKEELKQKSKNEVAKKYADMLSDTITTCVIATNQTYVDSLKSQNAFDQEAQKQALQMTLNSVLTILSDDAKIYLQELYGDFTQYILNRIESEVRTTK
jgi:hypothetical protein